MGKRVEVYRNLHTDCFSVRHNGKVIDAVHSCLLKDVTFVVQPAGRAKVLRERKKNVHAFVRGTRVDEIKIKVGQPLVYNPYKRDSFYYRCNGQPIYTAGLVLMMDNRIYLAETL